MNDPMVLAAAAVVVIGALTTALVTLIVAFGKMKSELLEKMAKVDAATTVTAAASVITSKKVDHLAVQAVELKTVTDDVHRATNSNYSALKEELAQAYLEVKEGRAEMAQSQVTIRELVSAVLGKEQANGEGIHTIAESLAKKTDTGEPS